MKEYRQQEIETELVMLQQIVENVAGRQVMSATTKTHAEVTKLGPALTLSLSIHTEDEGARLGAKNIHR